MSKLSARQRARTCHPKAFGLPEKARSEKARSGKGGNYPIPDKGHAISALTRSERDSTKRGNLTR